MVCWNNWCSNWTQTCHSVCAHVLAHHATNHAGLPNEIVEDAYRETRDNKVSRGSLRHTMLQSSGWLVVVVCSWSGAPSDNALAHHAMS